MQKEIMQIRSDIGALATDVRNLNRTLIKVEKVLENQAVLLEKQNVANKRILDLEKGEEKIEVRVRKLEDWQVRLIAIASVVATLGSTIVGILIKKFL